jgi:hypothetical protein
VTSAAGIPLHLILLETAALHTPAPSVVAKIDCRMARIWTVALCAALLLAMAAKAHAKGSCQLEFGSE